ncbi:S8 family peptidase [Natrinema thermotolerans]
MTNQSRRRILQTTGAVISTTILGAGAASAQKANSRFLIDLREVSRAQVPEDVEIIHDLSEIDMLAAQGDESKVGGPSATTPDIKVDWSGDKGGAVKEQSGPSVDERSNSHNHDGPPKNTEYQWDKRVQDVGDYTDKPDDGKSVHDTTTGEGTRVAVVDTGVSPNHPDLEGVVNEELSANFTTDGLGFEPNGAGDHGTHVAGIIAATNSNDGPAGGGLGTAPDTEIVSLRVFSRKENYTSDSLAAFLYAAEVGCDAANYSVGYPEPYVDPEEYPWLIGIRDAYRRTAKAVREKGMLIVNSAGNDGLNMNTENILSLPTEVEGIFGVSATGPIGVGWGDKHSDNEEKWLTENRLEEPTTQPAFYTNYGSAVDVSAAGGNADVEELSENPDAYNDLVYSTVISTDEQGNVVPGYGWKAGTSMAAPQVTAAVALVRSLRPDAGVEEVERLIKDTATMPEEGELYHGDGHLDLERLVKATK